MSPRFCLYSGFICLMGVFTFFNKITIFSCVYDVLLAFRFSLFSLFSAAILRIGVSWLKKYIILTGF